MRVLTASDQHPSHARSGLSDNAQFSLTMPRMWFNLAAAQGNESAKKNCDIAASHMTRDQLAQAQRLAREWRSASER